MQVYQWKAQYNRLLTSLSLTTMSTGLRSFWRADTWCHDDEWKWGGVCEWIKTMQKVTFWHTKCIINNWIGVFHSSKFYFTDTYNHVREKDAFKWVPQLFSICFSIAAAANIPIASAFAPRQYSSQISTHLPAGGPSPNREDREQY